MLALGTPTAPPEAATQVLAGGDREAGGGGARAGGAPGVPPSKAPPHLTRDAPWTRDWEKRDGETGGALPEGHAHGV